MKLSWNLSIAIRQKSQKQGPDHYQYKYMLKKNSLTNLIMYVHFDAKLNLENMSPAVHE